MRVSEIPESDAQRTHHWNSAYESHGVAGVSWFQAEPAVSLELIERLGVSRDGAIIDIGGGASTLVDGLVDRGFTDLTVLDISEAALRAARLRLGPGTPVTWLCQDLLSWSPERRYDLWHDRAVFHFLTDEADRRVYLQALRSGVAPGGALIMATFAENGPEYCSGLPVTRYSPDGLAQVLGTFFEVVEVREEVHTTPGGVVQPFIWIAAKKLPS